MASTAASTAWMQQHTTVSRLAKTKKPLSELHQLQRAVKELQRDASEQLVLEHESQATFEFLTAQIHALKSAFETLSDVLLNELDTMRRDTQRHLQAIDALVTRQSELHTATHTDVQQLTRTLELWSVKERDWAKDTELLKTSHAHNVAWMQQLQRDVMRINDTVHATTNDTTQRISSVSDDVSSFRVHWQQHTDDVLTQLHELDARAQHQAIEMRTQAQQRVDDMALLEQALSTLQTQQRHVHASVDDHMQHATAQQAAGRKKLDVLEAQCAAHRTALEQLRAKSTAAENEQRRRMENVSKMLSVFAEALHLPPSALARIA